MPFSAHGLAHGLSEKGTSLVLPWCHVALLVVLRFEQPADPCDMGLAHRGTLKATNRDPTIATVSRGLPERQKQIWVGLFSEWETDLNPFGIPPAVGSRSGFRLASL